MRFTVDRLDHIVINCKDIEITASWYQRVLGMEREEFGDGRTALKFGGQKINLRPSDADSRAWITGVNSRTRRSRRCASSPPSGRRTWWTTCTAAVARSRPGP